jgi:type I restriction enzyme S subunit
VKVKTIPSAWIRREGQRLDCGPYMSGALEAKIRFEEMSCEKHRLADVTAGHAGGIYNGPQFSRNFVDSLEFGVPFLGTSSMLRADLSDLPLLRKTDALSPKLSYLRVRPGMTLISCSGTIGRMVYARPDMDGMWSSQDILKVVPDPEKVPSGYVYAFLSGKYGAPLVTSGTYGAIIQHIEPQHIADLPMPRLGGEVEGDAHDLAHGASEKRSRAVQLLKAADDTVRSLFLPAASNAEESVWSTVGSNQLQSRMDAYYFGARGQSARRAFDSARAAGSSPLSEIADVFIPGIFKRRYAGDRHYGVPYITGADVFQLAPTSERYLMHRVVSENQLSVEKGTILIQEAGQLGGLIGRSVMVGSYLDGFAVSNNMVRVKAHDRRDAGFLFALLSTDEGVTLIAREAAGSSIPHMDASRLRGLQLPWPDQERRHEVSALVDEAIELRDTATADENQARALVEHAIEAA